VQPVVGRIADEMGTFVPLFRVMACVPLVGAVAALAWPGGRGAAARGLGEPGA
jgi:hypothetical protein